jgi:hypothetical protein
MQAVVSAVKSFRPKIAYAGPLQQWEDATSKAKEEAHSDRCKVEQLFNRDPLGASPKTIEGYVNDIMHMMAKLNVRNIEEVIADPTHFRPYLLDKCSSKGTEASHISRILGIFNRNPDLKRRYQAAYEVWTRASSEHNARSKREALCNAPSNPSQAENFVPMLEWHEKLKELEAAGDPHASLQSSLRLVFFAYACTMPPKRAEVGGIRIFETEPNEAEMAAEPNHMVMDSSIMRIKEHKTSKHLVHREGIHEDLTPRFMQVVRESLNRYPRTHLFVDARGNAYDRQGFSQWVQRTTQGLFGKRSPGLSLLRHAFCTHLDYNTMTGLEREENALRMGHEVKTQDRYRFLKMKPIRT